ncbi:MAG: molybdopterin-dependent oxidoreductase [Myxococcales bacterium]|nr:molybdopterin-dependent oxidoreductase [Myxococcales bacterium]
MEETDVILLVGSSTREAHPIFFHHVLKGVRNGARLYVVDPRRTSTAAWADLHLPLHVGSDIALANAIGYVLIEQGLVDHDFVRRATTGFDAWAEAVQRYRPEDVEDVTGVPAAQIRQLAIEYGKADRGVICWTLGITEHHNAVDNVRALINLSLATGKIGRWGCGLNPLRGQNNVQGGGDMGALPNKFPGFQDVVDPVARARVRGVWGDIDRTPEKPGWHLTAMFDAMHRGDLRGLWIFGENPAQSEANSGHAVACLKQLDHLVVQDIFLTKTAELADVVLPGTASWCESEGSVTNSERRVQRCRQAVPAPEGARDDIDILVQTAKRLGVDLGVHTPYEAWEELRQVSPMHAGMSWARMEAEDGLQWPCPSEDHPGTPFLHARLWEDPVPGKPAPFAVVEWAPVAEPVDETYPLLLTTGRKLDGYNTGVQSGHLGAPLSRGEALEIGPATATAHGLSEGDRVRVTSRRGMVETVVRIDPHLRQGLVFMTFHHPDQVDTNLLTVDTSDPAAGTAEFKAAAVRVERVSAAPAS